MQKFDEIPHIISGSKKMEMPNESIPIYTGLVHLIAENVTCVVDGMLRFCWYPHPGVMLTGTLVSGDIQLEFLRGNRTFEAQIDGLRVGDCTVIGFSQSTEGADTLTVNIHETIIGDSSILVTKVLFAVPNLRSFTGASVRYAENSICNNRLVFEDDRYTITMDMCQRHDKLRESLSSTSGYLILSYGELTSKKGPMQYDEAKEVLFAFGWYLSFLNGRRCSPLFRQGIHDDEILWTDYLAYPNSSYKYVDTWPQGYSIEGLNGVWLKFFQLWKADEGDKDFLLSAIHWYVEANGHAGLVDGSIIMIQTALELIYNWFLIEQKKLLIGDDAVNISAANKIRLLLSELGVSPGFFPEGYIDLNNADTVDAPDSLVKIRNALVHGQERKRKELSKIPSITKTHALHLGIWYVELSLLKILDFNGLYKRRGSTDNTMLKCPVPWSK